MINRLRLDTAGNVYVLGDLEGSMKIGSKQLTVTQKFGKYAYEMFLAKLAPSGKLLWATQGNSKYYTMSRNMDLDSKGNIYVLGYFDSMITFGGKNIFGLNMDVYLAKYDPKGVPQWAVRGGGPGSERAYGLHLVGNSAYIAGRCHDWAKFGNTTALSVTPYNKYDAFVAKLQVAP